MKFRADAALGRQLSIARARRLVAVAFFASVSRRQHCSQEGNASIQLVGHDYFVTDVITPIPRHALDIRKRTIPYAANVGRRNDSAARLKSAPT